MVVAQPDMTMKVWFETDIPPEESARYQHRHDAFLKSVAWFQRHSAELFRTHRGKHICIVDEQLFVGDTVDEALEQGRQARPDELGLLMWYIPQHRRERIYANRWNVVRLRRRDCSASGESRTPQS